LQFFYNSTTRRPDAGTKLELMRALSQFHKTAILIVTLAAGASAASGLKVLHAFGSAGTRGGSSLYGGLILDPSGNLYGTAEFGGTRNAGVVFRLSPQANGSWTETVLYSFNGGGQDGATPHDALLMDRAGNLYGTTIAGGGGQCRTGCGIVFQLSPSASGSWTETVLHRFAGGTDGATPYSGVVSDSLGNLYGATSAGGPNQAGTVYKLARTGTGGWNESVLYSFKGSPDGASPYAAPVFGRAGTLYGTTYGGGAGGEGTVYQLATQADGSWSETVLHSFHGAADGSDLFESLVMDASGNLYGAAETGGSANWGVVFKLARNGSGGWTGTILHTFLGVTAQDGENPNGLIFDASGNLYGTSVGGGVYNPGTIFKLTPNTSGEWTETVLYSFTGGNDGAYPSVPLIMDSAGNLFGTTLWGGPAGDTTGGVAFEFVP
jgi:uncharacterized repeat protein (TIGR03803 family)